METTDETSTACSFPRTRRKFVIKIRQDTKWKNVEDLEETPAPSSSPVASQSSNDTAASGFYYFNKRKLEEKLNVLATIQGISSAKNDITDDHDSEDENARGKSPLTEPLQSLSLSEHPSINSCDKDGLSIFYKAKCEAESFPSFSALKMSVDIVKPGKAPAAKKNRSE